MKYYAPRFLFRRYELLRRVRGGHSFMEIGAGNLALTRELLRYFDRGLAVDFTNDLPESYAALPDALRTRLDILNIDIMQDDVPGQFNCVVACEVMEHIENDVEFLTRIFGSLTTGGQAILSVPGKAKYWTVHDELVGHLRRYEKADLIVMSKKVGFTEIEVVSYGYPWINWLSHLRVRLARQTLAGRKHWNQKQQTAMSNHRQIPEWLSGSFVPLLVNPVTFWPFAVFSRLFNRLDLSDGYLLILTR